MSAHDRKTGSDFGQKDIPHKRNLFLNLAHRVKFIDEYLKNAKEDEIESLQRERQLIQSIANSLEYAPDYFGSALDFTDADLDSILIAIRKQSQAGPVTEETVRNILKFFDQKSSSKK